MRFVDKDRSRWIGDHLCKAVPFPSLSKHKTQLCTSEEIPADRQRLEDWPRTIHAGESLVSVLLLYSPGEFGDHPPSLTRKR